MLGTSLSEALKIEGNTIYKKIQTNPNKTHIVVEAKVSNFRVEEDIMPTTREKCIVVHTR